MGIDSAKIKHANMNVMKINPLNLILELFYLNHIELINAYRPRKNNAPIMSIYMIKVAHITSDQSLVIF